MDVYNGLSVGLAAILYVFLGKDLLKGVAVQNLATWVLWGLLDAEASASMYFTEPRGNWQLPAFYVAGCTAMIICMFKAKTIKWTWFETIISTMVIGCLIAWWMAGAWMATIISTIGVVIGGFPQLKDSYKEPLKSPLKIYCGFVVVNILSAMAGKSWSVEERLYPVSCVALCAAIVLVTVVRRELARVAEIEQEAEAGYSLN